MSTKVAEIIAVGSTFGDMRSEARVATSRDLTTAFSLAAYTLADDDTSVVNGFSEMGESSRRAVAM
jgi:hypothetical protein